MNSLLNNYQINSEADTIKYILIYKQILQQHHHLATSALYKAVRISIDQN